MQPPQSSYSPSRGGFAKDGSSKGGVGGWPTVVHVTASAANAMMASQHAVEGVQSDVSSPSMLLGQESAELLHDYARLFCPGLEEADALGFCVDGSGGGVGHGHGHGHGGGLLYPGQRQPPGFGPQQVRHEYPSVTSVPPSGVVVMQHNAQQQLEMSNVHASMNSSSTNASQGSPFVSLSVQSMQSAQSMVASTSATGHSSDSYSYSYSMSGGHEHLRVRTSPAAASTPPQPHRHVERSASHPPLSWAMRVSSPRPADDLNFPTMQSPISHASCPSPSNGVGTITADPEEPPPEILVGLDGQYQSYCRQIITPALNVATTAALDRLRNIQLEIEASMLGQPGVTKATIPRKYFCSLKEVAKVAKICKLLVIAPDIKPSPTAHIKPVKLLNSLVEDAQHAGVPYVFALSRKGIGQIFGRDKNMSIMALMDLDPVRAEVDVMLDEAACGRRLWEEVQKRRQA